MPIQRIPLTQPIETRDGTMTKDSKSCNCYFETRDQKRELVKRPGLRKAVDVINITPPAAQQSQGLYEFNNKLIAFIDNVVYSVDPLSYAISIIGGVTGAINQVSAVKDFLNAHLVFHNKNNIYYYTQSSGTTTQITSTTVTSVNVINVGSNYSQGATVTFSSAPVGGTTATGTPVVSGGTIQSITLTNGGAGYSIAPSVTINPAPTKTPTATGSGGAYTITVSSATGLYAGMHVSGTGIGSSAVVSAVVGTTVTLSVANSGSVSGTITFTDTGTNATASCLLNAVPTGPFVPGIVYLDTYIFVANAENRIYNSNLGDPTTWQALDYISFEQSTDNIVGIAKHFNYLVAFGEWSMQFYYDAGQTVPGQGSPLAVVPSYMSEVGCANGNSIVSTEQTVLWVGTSKVWGKSVFMLQGTSPTRVSTPYIDRIIENSTLKEVTAYTYKINGHMLYVLTFHDTNVTIVYDLNEQMWYQWTQWAMASEDQPLAGTYYESYFRPTFYAEVNNTPYCLDDDRGIIYVIDDSTYNDNGAPIYCRSVTDIVDNGTTKRKFYQRVEIIGDKVAAIMRIRHSGNDYKDYSAYRSVDLDKPRAQIYQTGQDRRRSWEFVCTDDVPLRIDAAEIDFEIGGLDQAQGVGATQYRR